MNPALIIFACQFIFITLLGFQQLNVARGNKLWSFVVSFGLGCCQLCILHYVPRASTCLEMGAFLFAGPLGIVAAIHFYPKKK